VRIKKRKRKENTLLPVKKNSERTPDKSGDDRMKGSSRMKAIMSSKTLVLYLKAGIFEKKYTAHEKKREYMIAGIKQICIFVAEKKYAWQPIGLTGIK
jgi:hypothetical protein